MSLDDRLKRLEDWLNPQPDKVEQECRRRKNLFFTLLMCQWRFQLTKEQRAALDAALQIVQTLVDDLPAHHCVEQKLSKEDEAAIQQLVMEDYEQSPDKRPFSMADPWVGPTLRERWEQHVPSIPFPWGEQAPLDAPRPDD